MSRDGLLCIRWLAIVRFQVSQEPSADPPNTHHLVQIIYTTEEPAVSRAPPPRKFGKHSWLLFPTSASQYLDPSNTLNSRNSDVTPPSPGGLCDGFHLVSMWIRVFPNILQPELELSCFNFPFIWFFPQWGQIIRHLNWAETLGVSGQVESLRPEVGWRCDRTIGLTLLSSSSAS